MSLRALLLIVCSWLAIAANPAICAEPVLGAPIDIAGVFHTGEPGQVSWRVQKPASWNGTLVLDLDFAPNGYAAAQRTWFLEKGYAIGGIQRTQNETAYELKKYVDDLIAVRQNLIDTGAGIPLRTVAFGASRGGFVSRMAVQYRPDIFKGAVAFAGGGSGVIAAWLGKADAVWALKVLVDPQSTLRINNLPDIAPGTTYGPTYEQDVALGALVTKARSTPQGTARLMLAAAFEQATDWGSGQVRPGATDYEAQAALIGGSFAFGNPQFVHKEIEVMAGGAVVWNHGVDYSDLLQRSGGNAIERVNYWYAKAGIDLATDLRTLRDATRFRAKPAAVQRVEQIGTFNGETGGPVLSIKTIGDSADPVSLDEAYVRTFAAAGRSSSLRSSFIERSGHSSQSIRERLTAVATLIERMDSGVWPDTSPAAMNLRASSIAAGTSVTDAQLGTAVFTPFELTPALRTWDFTNWGAYFSSYVDSFGLRRGALLTRTLDEFAVDLQKGRKNLACIRLVVFGLETVLYANSREASKDFLIKARDLAKEIGC